MRSLKSKLEALLDLIVTAPPQTPVVPLPWTFVDDIHKKSWETLWFLKENISNFPLRFAGVFSPKCKKGNVEWLLLGVC